MWLSFVTEKGDPRVKTEALKKVIQQILNGEKMPSLLMVIIKFLMPLDDHTIKKLLLIFWEIVPKTGKDGKLLQEMILVCDAYRKVRTLIDCIKIVLGKQNGTTENYIIKNGNRYSFKLLWFEINET